MRSPSRMLSTTSIPLTTREDGVAVVEAGVVHQVDEDLRVACVAPRVEMPMVPRLCIAGRLVAHERAVAAYRSRSGFRPGSRNSARRGGTSGRCSSPRRSGGSGARQRRRPRHRTRSRRSAALHFDHDAHLISTTSRRQGSGEFACGGRTRPPSRSTGTTAGRGLGDHGSMSLSSGTTPTCAGEPSSPAVR